MNDRTSDAVEILDMEFGSDPEYRQMLAEERVNSQAAKLSLKHDATRD